MDWMTHNAFFLLVMVVWIVVTAIALRGGATRGAVAGTARTCDDTTALTRSLDLKIVCWSLGTWAAVSFVICVLWGLVTPEALHMHAFLEQILPSFTWLTWWGFLLGLVESFLYGVYVGLVFVPIHNFFSRRFARP